jgi:hypothetical protein
VQGEVEEAVARARLDWLKRLPEMMGADTAGDLHRESLGQLGTGVPLSFWDYKSAFF